MKAQTQEMIAVTVCVAVVSGFLTWASNVQQKRHETEAKYRTVCTNLAKVISRETPISTDLVRNTEGELRCVVIVPYEFSDETED